METAIFKVANLVNFDGVISKIKEQTKKRLKANSNYDMCIDNLLFNMTFIIHN